MGIGGSNQINLNSLDLDLYVTILSKTLHLGITQKILCDATEKRKKNFKKVIFVLLKMNIVQFIKILSYFVKQIGFVPTFKSF